MGVRVRTLRPVTVLFVCLCLSLFVLSAVAEAQERELKIVSAGPTGEIASLPEGNEIRVVFSEPMVTLGKIPDPVTAPFFHIRPAVRGTFRWSGTTILIFTPDQDRHLPFATTYEVTVEAGATAISGRTLAQPYRFRFTTPTVRLLSTTAERRDGRYDSPLLIVLRFNQPVHGPSVFAHLRARGERHPFDPPVLPTAGVERLRATDPAGLAAFERKVAAARAAAETEAPVQLALARSWNQKRFPPARDQIVLETTGVPAPDTWVRLTVGSKVPSTQGRAVPGIEQHHTIQLPPTFFINGFQCVTACDPDEHNPARLRAYVHVDRWRAAVAVIDVTTRGKDLPVKPAAPKPRESFDYDMNDRLSLEDAGFEQPPARSWLVRVDPSLTATDGQTLGYPWLATVENWHQTAYTSFGDGHGVWETSGGSTLPFYARNFGEVRQWTSKIEPEDLMATILDLQRRNFRVVPDGEGTSRRLPVKPDAVQSHGIDLSEALGTAKTGLVWAGIREGTPIPRSRTWIQNREQSAIVQVTNLGITIKDSPDNTLIFVTRLDNGAPVAGARVSIIPTDGTAFWTGSTGEDGVAIAPETRLRGREWWDLAFIVTAEKDGDIAYAGSDWNEGLSPWQFGLRYGPDEADPLLRGTVFPDRGVYRLGEEIHLKAILRHDTRRGIDLLAPGTQIFSVVRDGEGREVDRRSMTVNEWSSAEWKWTLPARGTLGTYTVHVSLREPRRPDATDRDPDELAEQERELGTEEYDPADRSITNSFLVAAYRRPEFRVDVTLTGAPAIAGGTLEGSINARYLFGGAMGGAPVRYTLTRERIFTVPAGIRDRFDTEAYEFRHCCDGMREEVAAEEVELAKDGTLDVEHQTPTDLQYPYQYTLQGDVTDVSRQHIAGRAAFVVHPAPWYVGVKRPPYFVDQKTGFTTAIVAVTPDGTVTPGVEVHLSLTQLQFNSVRRAEGNGFYTWETTQKEVDAGSWTVTTAAEPVPLAVPLPAGGLFTLTARARDAEGRSTVTLLRFYAVGAGYTAWTRYDHNRIDLVPERTIYKPGDTARIMIQSPWEDATALVTMEREGVRYHRQFALSTTQQTVSVPIAEKDIPNVYVSVLLVKGRTRMEGDADGSDPGKPSFRLGYVELKVEDATKRLAMTVRTNREEYRPAGTATVDVSVRDAAGKPSSSEVTLWAVDYGVLSLTAFRTPDVLSSVYIPKALQVLTEDSRQRIVSRRAVMPKGESDGGGGGTDAGASTIRRDFKVLAFWLGSVQTDANGRATTQVKLPESLTTYRIMAVAGDRQSRFGSADSEIRINKPLLLRAAFPRFLAVGDQAHFGAAVTNQLARGGTATVTVQSLDPALLTFGGTTKQTIEITPGGTQEVRFDARAMGVGRARVRMTARMGSESDAFEDSIPVEVLASKETVAAYGDVQQATATEQLDIPAGVMTSIGGLDVALSSTAMVGLSEGVRYLVEYPYGCAEQRSSRALVLIYAGDMGQTFPLPGIGPDRVRSVVQDTVDELREFQCGDGAFTFWKGSCPGNAYLTAYVLHVLQAAQAFKYQVDTRVLENAAAYLERALNEGPPDHEGWWPAYTAWQTFAVNVLVRAGRNQDSNVTRLYGYRDRMPVFALAHLYDAVASRTPSDGRLADLQRRMANAILPEGGLSHVEELSDPYLLWFWNSNVRSTAIVLDVMVRYGLDEPLIPSTVRWLLRARKDGRWDDTQENAWALSSLVSYYRRYERESPDFRATVRLGRQELAKATFQGRSSDAVASSIPMARLLASGRAGDVRPLEFTKEGTGTLFYSARLEYANGAPVLQDLDSGIRVRRTYEKYVDGKGESPGTTFAAGDLVRVTLTLDLTKERRYVAVQDPLPAGLEPIESWFATTAQELAAVQQASDAGASWHSWWEHGGFDHVERHDDRVQLFATRLAEGTHEFSYITRATTAGTFVTAPAHAEEMYEPEVFGRTATATVTVKR